MPHEFGWVDRVLEVRLEEQLAGGDGLPVDKLRRSIKNRMRGGVCSRELRRGWSSRWRQGGVLPLGGGQPSARSDILNMTP